MERIKEVIVVEGRYDKNTVRQVVDAVVLDVGGFSVFSDQEKIKLLRRLAEERGLVILTDSDHAGFMIRNHLKNVLAGLPVKHAYIPDVSGKERRKQAPSKEGKLGVEGMRPEVILTALRRSGAVFLDDAPEEARARGGITPADLYAAGLSGTAGSGERRKRLLRRLELPENLKAAGLLDVLNALYSKEAFFAAIDMEEL